MREFGLYTIQLEITSRCRVADVKYNTDFFSDLNLATASLKQDMLTRSTV